jgi:hypothetical protein
VVPPNLPKLDKLSVETSFSQLNMASVGVGISYFQANPNYGIVGYI